MSQALPSDYLIDPYATSGVDLADVLNRLSGGEITRHSGVARPSYAKPGTLWMDDSQTPYTLKLFDGVNDYAVGYAATNIHAANWNPASSYAANQLVRGPDGMTYKANAYTPPGSWDQAKWTNISADILNQALASYVQKADLSALLPRGMIMIWAGAQNAIPAGWLLCDGGNGTPDLRNRFVVGAGSSYGVGATGGLASYNISWDQMPSHNHGVNDGGHGHSMNDPGHNHGVNDPGHDHDMWVDVNIGPNNWNSGAGVTGVSRYGSTQGHPKAIMGAGCGIWLNGSGTGVWVSNSGSNISIQSAGGGAAVENRPPYFALCYIMKS